MCDGIRHNYKWHPDDPIRSEGWYCIECLLPWEDDAQRQPIPREETKQSTDEGAKDKCE